MTWNQCWARTANSTTSSATIKSSQEPHATNKRQCMVEKRGTGRLTCGSQVRWDCYDTDGIIRAAGDEHIRHGAKAECGGWEVMGLENGQ